MPLNQRHRADEPSRKVIHEGVWQPIAEMAVAEVFAFGRAWDNLSQALGLRRIDALRAGGRDYLSSVPSRAVHIYELPTAQWLILEWHAGSAGPPNAEETAVLRAAIS